MDFTSDSDADDGDYFNCCENDESMLYNLNAVVPVAAVVKRKVAPNQTVLNPSDVLSLMMSEIYDSEVITMLNVSEVVARHLLNHYNWKRENLINEFLDAADIDFVLRLAKIPLPNQTSCDEPGTCGICLISADDENDNNVRTTLTSTTSCDHQFCGDCWMQYLRQKIFEDGVGDWLSCPGFNCHALLDDTMVLSMVDVVKVRDRFLQAITHKYVLCHPFMRWCPAIDCTQAIRVEHKLMGPVECRCGYRFCFGCGEFNHEPVECALLKRWTTTAVDDLETARWISQHAKKCPKCGSPIEKNGGCNHMTCRKCTYEFCWICIANWATHNACNQYPGTVADGSRIDLISPERYRHYNQRYQNHSHSLKLEAQLYDRTERKMQKMVESNGFTSNEVSFLRRAIEVLCRSRQILSASYVFAYFTYCDTGCHQLHIFEDNQGDLEVATEALSGYMEHDIDGDDFVRIKQALIEKTEYCDRRRKVLLDHIHEGYDKQWWRTL